MMMMMMMINSCMFHSHKTSLIVLLQFTHYRSPIHDALHYVLYSPIMYVSISCKCSSQCFYWFLPTVLVLESNVLEFKINYDTDVTSQTEFSSAQICVLNFTNTYESQYCIVQFTEPRNMYYVHIGQINQS
jgi:hypothetical protein